MKDLFLYFLPTFLSLSVLPLVAAAAYLRPRWFGHRARWWRRVEKAWGRISRRPLIFVAVLCAIQIGGAAFRYAVRGIPPPHVHDEFSYLLAGETFASGRLTNPTHPMWVFFESPHIIHVPTYTSFYPPGQAIALAAGFLLGHPWLGVILSTLIMIGLIYWAARQWLAPFWSALAGVMGLCLVLGTYWTDTYWGGAVNALAGALVTGAAGSLRRGPSALHLLIYASGVALCAITRPFEGLVLTMLVTCWLLWRVAERGRKSLFAYLRLSLPAALLLAGSAGAFLYYNYTVTGNALTMPYSEGARQYIARRKFLFEKDPPTPVYRHKELRDTYVGLRRTNERPYWRVYGNLSQLAATYVSIPLVPLFVLSMLLVLRGWRSRLRPMIFTAMGGVAAVLTIPWINPHYYGPFAAAAIMAVIAALRMTRNLSLGGVRPGWIIIAAVFGILATRGTVRLVTLALPDKNPPYAWGLARTEIETRLSAEPGGHLLLVRYQPGHIWHHEWVYNHADIDASKIVWAREMDASNNARLIEYFKNRRVWLLEADAQPPQLTPYPAAGPVTPSR